MNATNRNLMTVSRHRTMTLAVEAAERLTRALEARGVGAPDYVALAAPAVRGPEWHVMVDSVDSDHVTLLTVADALLNAAA